jgi:hypothetical protein
MALMSGKELSRLEVVREVAAKRMKIAQAAGRLGLLRRQIKAPCASLSAGGGQKDWSAGAGANHPKGGIFILR